MKRMVLMGSAALLLFTGCMAGAWRPGDGHGYYQGSGMMGPGGGAGPGSGGYGQGYGPGMMGWGGRRGYRNWDESNKEMSITPEEAIKNAQAFLDERLPGTQAENGADAFYGYYTLHVEKDGKTIGMLGVNGYTGWVWYHEWHGKFIGMKDDF